MTRWKLRGLSPSATGVRYGCDDSCGHVVEFQTTPGKTPMCCGRPFDDDGESTQVRAPAGAWHPPKAMTEPEPDQ